MERRTFLKSLSSFITRIAIPLPNIASSLIVLPFLGGSFGETTEREKQEILKELSKKENRFVYVRSWNVNIINIGVKHENLYIKSQLEDTLLGKSISECEIFLHEAGEYFKILSTSLKGGVPKICIDRGNNLTDFLQISLSLWAGFRSLKQIKDDSKLTNTDELNFYRYAITTLGIGQLGMFPPSLLVSVLGKNEDRQEYYLKRDISFTGDARTVFMAIEVLKQIEANPDKKILIVTGDSHALGIDYYLYKEGGEYLRLKNAIYSIIYSAFNFKN